MAQWLVQMGCQGAAGLLRDCSGQSVVGFAKSISVSSSIAAELWALREGLGLCLERGISTVEIELDATAAISLVSSNVNSKGDLSGLVDPVLLMIARNCCCVCLTLSYHIASRKLIFVLMC